MNRFSRVVLVSAFAVLLVAIGGSLRAAPDKTPGMALMSAFVSPAGTLLGGTGAKSAERFNEGAYSVFFQRSVEGCNFVAGVGRADGFINPSGIATAWWSSGDDAVVVFTNDFTGALNDSAFQVIVLCGR
jgi:hypothetical protein